MRKMEDDIQQGATGRLWILDGCGEDTASVHGVHAPPAELQGCTATLFQSHIGRANIAIAASNVNYNVIWQIHVHVCFALGNLWVTVRIYNGVKWKDSRGKGRQYYSTQSQTLPVIVRLHSFTLHNTVNLHLIKYLWCRHLTCITPIWV